jgi:hypothetical protein
MLPTWAFVLCALVSGCVFVSALASVGFALARRWAATRLFGRISVLGGIAIIAVAILLIIAPTILGVDLGSGPESKATILARMISQIMNTTAIAFPGLVIGALTWPLGAIAGRRRDRDAA